MTFTHMYIDDVDTAKLCARVAVALNLPLPLTYVGLQGTSHTMLYEPTTAAARYVEVTPLGNITSRPIGANRDPYTTVADTAVRTWEQCRLRPHVLVVSWTTLEAFNGVVPCYFDGGTPVTRSMEWFVCELKLAATPWLKPMAGFTTKEAATAYARHNGKLV